MPYREKADLRRRGQPRARDVRGSARRGRPAASGWSSRTDADQADRRTVASRSSRSVRQQIGVGGLAARRDSGIVAVDGDASAARRARRSTIACVRPCVRDGPRRRRGRPPFEVSTRPSGGRVHGVAPRGRGVVRAAPEIRIGGVSANVVARRRARASGREPRAVAAAAGRHDRNASRSASHGGPQTNRSPARRRYTPITARCERARVTRWCTIRANGGQAGS